MTRLFKGPAIRVIQPIGEFWAVSIPASLLLQVTHPDPLRMLTDPSVRKGTKDWDLAGRLLGNQRPIEQTRLSSIAKFIDSMESSFPNSIILAANSHGTDDEVREDAQWQIVEEKGVAVLSIPRDPVKASVVDGQHRLYAFQFATEPERKDFELLCSVFFDIPQSMQAVIFATINTTQKQVRRGLAMNLYGYNIEDEDRSDWSPEKLAVFLVRRLNFDKSSPLFKRVRIEARNAPEPKLLPGAKRAVPMAAVVDGVLGVISRKPKDDRSALHQKGLFTRSKKRGQLADDKTVLRDIYTSCQDAVLYDVVRSFVEEVNSGLWKGGPEGSMLTRAVGIRGLFDFMADLLVVIRRDTPIPPEELADALREKARTALAKGRPIDFRDAFFEASYRGRRRIENVFRLVNALAHLDQMSETDRADYVRILKTAQPEE